MQQNNLLSKQNQLIIQHNNSILTMNTILTISLLVCLSTQKSYTYLNISNNLTINQNTSLVLSELVLLSQSQYLEHGSIISSIALAPTFPNQNLTFNFLVFNLSDQFSIDNYNTAIQNMSNYTSSCQDCSLPGCIQNLTNWQISSGYCCCKNCVNQNISLIMPEIDLEQLKNANLLIMLDPSLCNNTGPLNMTMESSMRFSAEDVWFYWEVVLSCLLVFSIVVLTGVTINLCLKFKKSTQKLEKLELTRPKAE